MVSIESRFRSSIANFPGKCGSFSIFFECNHGLLGGRRWNLAFEDFDGHFEFVSEGSENMCFHGFFGYLFGGLFVCNHFAFDRLWPWHKPNPK
jgi:hypothetical protein